MDLSQFHSNLSWQNKVARLVWGYVWLTLFFPSPKVCQVWRRFLLRCFGARVGRGVRVDRTVKVFLPANLELGDHAVIGPHVDLYCVASLKIGDHAMVSQYSYLCTATHDYTQPHLPLIALPIGVGERTWICAGVFVGPGVRIGRDVVVAARAVVVKDIDDHVIVGGNPAKFIKQRTSTATVPRS